MSAVTPAERRVAEVLIAQPETVAFGTVADLAGRAAVGVATVARLATKLGYDGFRSMQEAVQHDLARQLRPAAERIRTDSPDPQRRVEHHLQLEVENLQLSLDGLENGLVSEVSGHLANARRVWILSGDASSGIADQFAHDLTMLRDNVAVLAGNQVHLQRQLAAVEPSDTVIAVDIRRYDRWVVEAAAVIAERQAWTVAVTDHVLSPLAERADRAVVVAAGGGGPFDSHVGTLAVLNVFVAGAAHELRAEASPRLERAERAWTQSGALLDL